VLIEPETSRSYRGTLTVVPPVAVASTNAALRSSSNGGEGQAPRFVGLEPATPRLGGLGEGVLRRPSPTSYAFLEDVCGAVAEAFEFDSVAAVGYDAEAEEVSDMAFAGAAPAPPGRNVSRSQADPCSRRPTRVARESHARANGSGLGLAIAQAYARAHGGEIVYEPAIP
jgi:hypothetical protein